MKLTTIGRWTMIAVLLAPAVLFAQAAAGQ